MRDHNEDAHLVVDDLGLLAVADGMGGLAHGEIASATVVNTIRSARDSVSQVLRAIGPEPDAGGRLQLAATLELLTNLCNTQIQRSLGAGVSGSTLVLGFVVGGQLLVCNTGDSRAYLFRGGRLRRITDDHTVAAAQLRAGVISEEEHDQSPYQHMLYQALGTQPEVDPDLFHEPLAEGDVVLLCSDGLTGPVSEGEIESILSSTGLAGTGLPGTGLAGTGLAGTGPGSGALETAVGRLIDAANEGGGPDNITIIAARATEGPTAEHLDREREILEGTPPLSQLNGSDLRMLQLYMEWRQLAAGATVDPGEGVQIVLQGQATQGARRLGPGDVFGVLPFADAEQSEPAVAFEGEGRVLMLSRDAFQQIERRRPNVASRVLRGLLREMAQRLSETL